MREFWQKTREYAVRMWKGMNPGQRAAFVALVLIVAVGILWGLRAAAPAGMRLLVAESAEPNVKTSAREILTEANIPYELRDGAIYVAREHYDGALLDLYGANIFNDSQLYAWLEEQSLTATRWDRERRWQVAMQRKIERAIMSLGVFREVDVNVSVPTERVRVGMPQPNPTAQVTAQVSAGAQVTRNEIRAIGGIIRGAVTDIDPQDIFVQTVDTSGDVIPWRLPNEDEGAWILNEYHDLEIVRASHIRRELEPLLRRNYHDAEIAVRVALTTATEHQRSVTHQNPQELLDDSESRTASERMTQQGIAPGTVATGSGPAPQIMASSGGPTVDSNSTETESRSDFDNDTTERVVQTPAGAVSDISVQVMIPRAAPPLADGSTWDGSLRLTTDVSPAVLNQIPPEARRIFDIVADHIGAGLQTGSVSIVFMGDPPGIDMPVLSLWEQTQGFLAEHWARLLLLLVALVVLFMVYRLVKTALRVRAELGLEELEKAAAEGPELAAMAAMGEKTARMRTMIRDLINKNPRAVATVLRRWMGGK